MGVKKNSKKTWHGTARGKGWAKKPQKAWLMKWMPRYEQCMKTKKYSGFWKDLKKEWQIEFPFLQELFPGRKFEDLSPSKKVELHDGCETKRKPSASVMSNVFNKKRKKKEFQVFAELFPEVIKDPINNACKEKGVAGQDRLSTQRQVVQEMWEAATDEQKLAVWKFIEDAKKEQDPDSPEEIQKAIDAIPAILTLAIEPLATKTKLAFFVTYVGPFPELEGRVKVRNIQFGEKLGSSVLGEVYPDREGTYNEKVSAYYIRYVHPTQEEEEEEKEKEEEEEEEDSDTESESDSEAEDSLQDQRLKDDASSSNNRASGSNSLVKPSSSKKSGLKQTKAAGKKNGTEANSRMNQDVNKTPDEEPPKSTKPKPKCPLKSDQPNKPAPQTANGESDQANKPASPVPETSKVTSNHPETHPVPQTGPGNGQEGRVVGAMDTGNQLNSSATGITPEEKQPFPLSNKRGSCGQLGSQNGLGGHIGAKNGFVPTAQPMNQPLYTQPIPHGAYGGATFAATGRFSEADGGYLGAMCTGYNGAVGAGYNTGYGGAMGGGYNSANYGMTGSGAMGGYDGANPGAMGGCNGAYGAYGAGNLSPMEGYGGANPRGQYPLPTFMDPKTHSTQQHLASLSLPNYDPSRLVNGVLLDSNSDSVYTSPDQASAYQNFSFDDAFNCEVLENMISPDQRSAGHVSSTVNILGGTILISSNVNIVSGSAPISSVVSIKSLSKNCPQSPAHDDGLPKLPQPPPQSRKPSPEQQENHSLPKDQGCRCSNRPPAPSMRANRQNEIGTNVVRPPLSRGSHKPDKTYLMLAVTYFNSLKLGDDFDSMVMKWARLEEQLEFGKKSKGTLPNAGARPSEGRSWISRTWFGQRDYANSPRIPPADGAEFGDTVKKHWNSMQPSFRQNSDGTQPLPVYSSPNPGSGDPWSDLRKSGANSFVCIVTLLAWWGVAASVTTPYYEDSRPSWQKMVLDVAKCLEEMSNVSKRSNDGDEDGSGPCKKAQHD